MDDKQFYKRFKEHLAILKNHITKTQVLQNLYDHNCPFALKTFNPRFGLYLCLDGRQIVAAGRWGEKFEESTDYFQKHKQDLVSTMIEIVKKTQWASK